MITKAGAGSLQVTLCSYWTPLLVVVYLETLERWSL